MNNFATLVVCFVLLVSNAASGADVLTTGLVSSSFPGTNSFEKSVSGMVDGDIARWTLKEFGVDSQIWQQSYAIGANPRQGGCRSVDSNTKLKCDALPSLAYGELYLKVTNDEALVDSVGYIIPADAKTFYFRGTWPGKSKTNIVTTFEFADWSSWKHDGTTGGPGFTCSTNSDTKITCTANSDNIFGFAASGGLTVNIQGDSLFSGSNNYWYKRRIGWIKPVVTPQSNTYPINNIPQITIAGYGFDPWWAQNSAIGLTLGASATKQSVSNGGKQMVVSISSAPNSVGVLKMTVKIFGITSDEVTIANIVPALTQDNNAVYALGATSIEIKGAGFGSAADQISISLNRGIVCTPGTPTGPGGSAFPCAVTTPADSTGDLLVTVTVNGFASTQVKVGAVVPNPTITEDTTSKIGFGAGSLTFQGTNFGTDTSRIQVELNLGATCQVTAVTDTQVTCNLNNKPAAVGSLTAIVRRGGFAVGPTQIKTVVNIPKLVVERSGLFVPATSVTMSGSYFGTIQGDVSVSLSNGATCSSITLIPAPDIASPPPATCPGLWAQYWPNRDLTGASIVQRRETDITNDWGQGIPVVGIGRDQFSIRWTGTLRGSHATGTETYTFYAASDDGVRIKIGNGVGWTMEDWRDRAETTSTFTFALDANVDYPFIMEYYENGGDASIKLEWQSNSNPRNRIPAAQFTTDKCDLPVFPEGAQIVCTFGTQPSSGFLSATVTVAGVAGSSTVIKYISTVRPTVTADANAGTASGIPLSVQATSLTLDGTNFYTNNPSANIVTLSAGKCVVTAATSTQLTCTLLGRPFAENTVLQVTALSSNGVAGTQTFPINVRTFRLLPVVYESFASDPVQTGKPLAIDGTQFSDSVQPVVTLTLNLPGGGTGTVPSFQVTSYTQTRITVTFNSPWTQAGNVMAVVQVGSLSSTFPTQVKTIRNLPTITTGSGPIPPDANQLVITGTGFSNRLGENTVILTPAGTCDVTIPAPTQIKCVVSGQLTLGDLRATVSVDGIDMAGQPVVVAKVVPRPMITASKKGFHSATTTITMGGVGFLQQSTSDGTNSVTLDIGSCTVTSATTTQLICQISTYPDNYGPVHALTVTSGVITTTFAQPVRIGTFVAKPTITNALDQYNGPGFTQMLITGTGFALDAVDNQIIFSSGTCVVSSNPPPTPTSLYCNVDAFQVESGTFTAKAVIYETVQSDAVPIYTFKPYFPPDTTNKISIQATQLLIPGYYLTDTLSDVHLISLPDYNTTCTPQMVSITSILCSLEIQLPSIGPLNVIVEMNVEGENFTSPVTQIGVVVPYVADGRSFIINATDTSLTLPIDGLGFGTDYEANTVTFQPEDSDYTCNVTYASGELLYCDLSVTDPDNNPIVAGLLTGVVRVKHAESGIFVTGTGVVASIRPVINEDLQKLIQPTETQLLISGSGFSVDPTENTVAFDLSGVTCTVTASTNDLITCTLYGTLQLNDVLVATVTTREIDSLPAQVALVSDSAPIPTTNPGANPAIDNPSGSTITPPDGPLSVGAIAGIAVGAFVLLAAAIVGAIFLVRHLRQGAGAK